MYKIDLSKDVFSSIDPYLLQIEVCIQQTNKAAVVSSDGCVALIDFSENRVVGVIDDRQKVFEKSIDMNSITSFNYTSADSCFISYSNGLVGLKDLRIAEASFFGTKKPSRSNAAFDNSFLLAVGYEDKSIDLWDVRNTAHPLGTLEYFHTDEISHLKFHPFVPSQLFSGACDWLVCRFDLSAGSIDEAFQSCFNLEQNPRRFDFFGPQCEFMHCITEVETLSLINLMEEDVIASFGHNAFQQGSDRSEGERGLRDIVNCVYIQETQELAIFQSDMSGTLYVYTVSEQIIPLKSVQPHSKGVRDLVSIPGTNVSLCLHDLMSNSNLYLVLRILLFQFGQYDR